MCTHWVRRIIVILWHRMDREFCQFHHSYEFVMLRRHMDFSYLIDLQISGAHRYELELSHTRTCRELCQNTAISGLWRNPIMSCHWVSLSLSSCVINLNLQNHVNRWHFPQEKQYRTELNQTECYIAVCEFVLPAYSSLFRRRNDAVNTLLIRRRFILAAFEVPLLSLTSLPVRDFFRSGCELDSNDGERTNTTDWDDRRLLIVGIGDPGPFPDPLLVVGWVEVGDRWRSADDGGEMAVDEFLRENNSNEWRFLSFLSLIVFGVFWALFYFVPVLLCIFIFSIFRQQRIIIEERWYRLCALLWKCCFSHSLRNFMGIKYAIQTQMVYHENPWAHYFVVQRQTRQSSSKGT